MEIKDRPRPRIYSKNGVWYCVGPGEPRAGIVPMLGADTPDIAFERYLARCEYRAGLPADIAS